MLNSQVFADTLKRFTRKPGRLVVVSSPTAAGKTTICRALVRADKSCIQSISCTTRALRGKEKHGKDYFFISEKKFKEQIKKGFFLEWAKVHTSYYGTPSSFVAKHLKKGKNIILTIDVQGGKTVKKNFKDAILVFVLPPSFKEQERRLKHRGTEDRRCIKIRLKTAAKELREIKNYEYLVINDTVGNAVSKIRSIITAENTIIR